MNPSVTIHGRRLIVYWHYISFNAILLLLLFGVVDDKSLSNSDYKTGLALEIKV